MSRKHFRNGRMHTCYDLLAYSSPRDRMRDFCLHYWRLVTISASITKSRMVCDMCCVFVLSQTQSLFAFLTGRPTFTQKPRQAVLLVEGNTLKLICKADGYPTPTIKWLKGFKEVTIDQRVRVSKTGTLRIKKAQLDDSGKYRCIADNGILGGYAVAQTKVHVYIPWWNLATLSAITARGGLLLPWRDNFSNSNDSHTHQTLKTWKTWTHKTVLSICLWNCWCFIKEWSCHKKIAVIMVYR